MGLETGTTIAQLSATDPLSTDPRSQGDDHLRLIKAVLKAQFPGAAGFGFAIPITATEAEINNIHNKNLDAFPSGTKIPFYQASPPVGWTLSNPGTNYTLVCAAAGGTVGGGAGRGDNIVAGCTVIPDHSHAQQGTFSSGIESANHTHSLGFAVSGFFNGTGGGAISDAARSFSTGTSGNNSVNHVHSTTISGQTSNVNAGAGASTAIGTWSPLYARVVIGSKT